MERINEEMPGWANDLEKKIDVHVKRTQRLEQRLGGRNIVDTEQPIAVVASKKTAYIASIAIPKYMWLDTGGKQNCGLFEALEGHDVTLFPTLGDYDEWHGYAVKYGFKISRVLEDIATDEDRNNGLDIADYLLRERVYKY